MKLQRMAEDWLAARNADIRAEDQLAVASVARRVAADACADITMALCAAVPKGEECIITVDGGFVLIGSWVRFIPKEPTE